MISVHINRLQVVKIRLEHSPTASLIALMHFWNIKPHTTYSKEVMVIA